MIIWKRPKTIYKNLIKQNTENRSRMSGEELFKAQTGAYSIKKMSFRSLV